MIRKINVKPVRPSAAVRPLPRIDESREVNCRVRYTEYVRLALDDYKDLRAPNHRSKYY